MSQSPDVKFSWSVRSILHNISSILFLWKAPLTAHFGSALAVGLSLNVKLVRQNGVQAASSVGVCSRTLNLVHLDCLQSETPDEAKQCWGTWWGAVLHGDEKLLAKVLVLLWLKPSALFVSEFMCLIHIYVFCSSKTSGVLLVYFI